MNHNYLTQTPAFFQERIERLQRQLADAQAQIRDLKAWQADHDNYYQVMFDIGHSVKLLIDPDDGRIVEANQAASRFYGYDIATLTSMKISDINQLDPADIHIEMQKARTERRNFFNFPHRLASGEIRYVEVYTGPIEARGRTLLYSIIHDVTESKADEIGRRLLWHAVNQSANSIIITDRDGHIEYVNSYFTRLTGYTLKEVFGERPSILKSGSTSDEEYRHLWQTITSGHIWSGEFRNRKKNGELYWEHASISPIVNEDGDITHFVAIKEDITRRKAAEDALRDSEIRFRTLVNSMDDIVFTLDRDGRHTGVYGLWLSRHGTKAETFLGKTAREIVGDDAAQVHEEANARAMAGESVVYDWKLGGQTIQTSLSPLQQSDGEIVGAVGIGRDISHLKAVQNQLRQAERFAHATVDALSAHIAILDQRGFILDVNDAWNRFAAANGGDQKAVGKGASYFSVLNAVDPASPDADAARIVLEGIQQVIRRERDVFMLEYPCHSPDEQRWFIVRVTRFGGGGPTRVVVAHENITERVLAEQQLEEYSTELAMLVAERTEQLQRLNQRMNAVLNNVSNPVLLLEADGSIDIANPALIHKLGYESEGLFGQPFWSIFEATYQHTLIALFSRLRDGPNPRPLQARLMARDGTAFDVEVSLSGVPGNDGYVVCTMYDISHLKEVERVKDEFVSMVSHELRTPISSMLLSSSTMKQYYDRLTEEQKLRKLGQINYQAQVLTDLVTSILDISRLNARQGKLRRDTVDVAAALREIAEELEEQASANQQRIEIQIVNSLITVTGEHNDLVRIWRNLLSNAMKYSPDGSIIYAQLYGACASEQCLLPDLTAFRGKMPADLNSGRYVIGLVEDSGHGIPAQDLPQLFSRFYRGWAAGTSITGSGLGLSLVRDLLQLYGGGIAVRSEIGTGTTFCFWLPVDQKEEDEQ